MAKTYTWKAVSGVFSDAADWIDNSNGNVSDGTTPGTADLANVNSGTISGIGTVDTFLFDGLETVDGTLTALTGVQQLVGTLSLGASGSITTPYLTALSGLILQPGAVVTAMGAANIRPLTLAGTISIDDATLNAAVGTVLTNEVSVGQFGSASLVAQGGATITSWGVNIGAAAGLSSSVLLTGAGTTWTVFGASVLSINPGGYIYVAMNQNGSAGNLTISDGALFTADFTFVAEGDSSGTLTISSGGTLSSGGDLGFFGGTATAIVDGSGSQWKTTGTIDVGYSGNGILTISNKGSVSAASEFAVAVVAPMGQGNGTSGVTTIESDGILSTIGSIEIGSGSGADGTVDVLSGGTVTSTGANSLNELGSGIGSTGSAIVDGSGSTWTTAGSFIVGAGGTGSITVSNSGSVSVGIGITVGSASVITIESSGVVSTGGLNATGTLDVLGGGTLTSPGATAINSLNSASGSTGTAFVDGTGSKWTTGGVIFVGQSGTGSLTVSNRGSVSVAAEFAVGSFSGSSGIATIESDGVIAAGSIVVGNQPGASGTTDVLAGGTLETTGSLTDSVYVVDIGVGSSVAGGGTGSGAVLVSGVGALLTTSGNPLRLGSYGTGSLTISQGGTAADGVVDANNDAATSVGSHGTGTITVTDPGSSFTSNGQLYLGHNGSGTLVVENFATATIASGELDLGDGGTNGSGGTGSVTVDSSGYLKSDVNIFVGFGGDTGTLNAFSGGTVETSDRLIVGTSNSVTSVPGSGSVNITAGGTVLVDAGNITASGTAAVVLGAVIGATGTMSLTGSGAALVSNGVISVGSTGTGRLTVAQGASLQANAQFIASNAALVIGGNAGASGTLLVSDTGTRVSLDGQLDVGNAGNGSASIQGGAALTSGDPTGATSSGISIANSADSSGTLLIDGVGTMVSNTGRFAVGRYGTGSLTVSGGAVVTSTGDTTTNALGMSIGQYTGATGAATVTGAGSTVILVNGLAVGGGGSTFPGGGAATQGGAGALSIFNSGVVTVSGGAYVFGTGSVSLAGGALQTDATTIFGGGAIGGNGTVSGAVADNGLITASGGNLSIAGAVTGTGKLAVAQSATLEVGAASIDTTFDAPGILKLDNPTGFTGRITAAAGDTIDLVGDSGATAQIVRGATLDVTGGTGAENFSFAGNYSALTASTTADASGTGTDIILSSAASISGSVARQTVAPTGTLNPFSTVSIVDPFNSARDTLTVTLSGPGDGTLSNLAGGTYDTATGVYSITGSLGAVQTALDGLVFTPSQSATLDGTTTTTNFAIAFADGIGPTATDSITSVAVTYPAARAPSISGSVAGQTVAPTGTLAPFSAVSLVDPSNSANDALTVTLSAPGDGTLANLAGGTYDVATGVYSVAGSLAAVQAALDGLMFTPSQSTTLDGTSTMTNFTIAFAVGIGPTATDSTTSILVTYPAAGAPSISGSVAGQTVAPTGTLAPFSTVSLVDPLNGANDSLTVTLSAPGDGTLTNLAGGTYDVATGVYSVAGSLAAVQAALDGLVFTPSQSTTLDGMSTTTTFVIAFDDAISRAVTDSTTSVAVTYPSTSGGAGGTVTPLPTITSPTAAALITALTPAGTTPNVVTTSTGTTSAATVAGALNVLDATGLAAGVIATVPGGFGAAILDGGTGGQLRDSNGNTLLVDQATGGALTGAANDTLIGGNGNSTLTGTSGAETLTGGTGATFFSLGASNAVVSSQGSDTIIGSSAGASVTTSGAALYFRGSGPTNFVATGGAPTLVGGGAETVSAGNTSALVFGGSGGALNFVAGGGASTVIGGVGAPVTLTGGSGPLLYFGNGATTYTPGTAVDTVLGFTGSLTATGGANGAVFFGGTAGNNVLSSGPGKTTIIGGGSGDLLSATGSSTVAIAASSGAETINGAASSGTDFLFGGFGSDCIVGGAGTNDITAGPGNMTLTGGGAVDLFIFDAGATSTTLIKDFNTAHDFVHLAGFAASVTGASVLSTATTSGGSETITLPDNTKITFQGVTGLTTGSFA